MKPDPEEAPVLSVAGLDVRYGEARVLHDVSLSVRRGEIVSLVGANGAGKSTTLKAVSGLVRPRSGRILFAGRDVTGRPAHEVARLGIAHVPEGRGVFANMTVRENILMGGYARSRAEVAESLDRVFSLFPRLRERARQSAGTLSGGEQQMLAIGRGLAARPGLLLLDEPSMGLAPLLVEEIFGLVREINAGGTTILLVEQNASMALSVADRAYVLEAGRVAVAGAAADLRDDPAIRAAYLGDVRGDPPPPAPGRAPADPPRTRPS